MLKNNSSVSSSQAGKNTDARSAKRALVNVILLGGYFMRVTRDQMKEMIENSELIAVEG